MKKLIALAVISLMMSPLMATAEDEVEGGLPLIRTTVYYAPEGAKTSTGKVARYGIVAFDPQYYGKTFIPKTMSISASSNARIPGASLSDRDRDWMCTQELPWTHVMSGWSRTELIVMCNGLKARDEDVQD